MSIIKKIDGYYFRGYIPRHLQLKYGKKTQDKKLYTKNKKEALKLVTIVKIEFEYEIYTGQKMAKIDKKSFIRSRIDDYVNEVIKYRGKALYESKNLNDTFDNRYDMYIQEIKAYENAIKNDSYSIISSKYWTLDTEKSLIDIVPRLGTNEIYYAQVYYVKALLNGVETLKKRLLDYKHKNGNQITNLIPDADAMKVSSDLSNNSNELKEVNTSSTLETKDNNINKPLKSGQYRRVIRSRIDDYVNKSLKDREKDIYTNKHFDDKLEYTYAMCIEKIKAYENAMLEDSYSIISTKNWTLDTEKSLIDILSIPKLGTEEMHYAQAYYIKALLNLEQTMKKKFLDYKYKDSNQTIDLIPDTDEIKVNSDLSNNFGELINQLKEITTLVTETKDNNINKPILVPNLEQYHKEFMILEYEENNTNASDDTISKHNLVIKSLLMYYGKDINVNEITAKDMEDYRATLEQLPLKWSEKKDYKNCKTLKEIIEERDKLGKDFSRLKPNTVGPKYISKVKAFFNYVSSQGKENNFKNPASHLTYGNNKKKLGSTEWEEFSNSELETIFSTDFYTSKLEVNIKNKIELIYAPILSLYSTMRRNELSSLYTNDIKEIEGVYYFDINTNDDKTTKNEKSIRKIPIHSKIIESGFMEYYEHMKKQGNVRLWTKLTKFIKNTNNDKSGYGGEISDWFNKLVDKNVTKDPSRVFHSLRNNAIDSLKQNSDATFEQRYAIQGHTKESKSDITRMDELYSHPLNAKKLKPFVDQMKYDVKSLDEAIKNIGVLVKKYYV